MDYPSFKIGIMKENNFRYFTTILQDLRKQILTDPVTAHLWFCDIITLGYRIFYDTANLSKLCVPAEV